MCLTQVQQWPVRRNCSITILASIFYRLMTLTSYRKSYFFRLCTIRMGVRMSYNAITDGYVVFRNCCSCKLLTVRKLPVKVCEIFCWFSLSLAQNCWTFQTEIANTTNSKYYYEGGCEGISRTFSWPSRARIGRASPCPIPGSGSWLIHRLNDCDFF